ncbi:hypothetical protein LBMAG49_23500 [Planctomycetota bacterium]|nr:hypothetical protein [Planctomycetota bacterium]GDY03021.1 hypothetical protein LBMAG49_23500 [Planctomycetota bacterium]
MAATIKQTYPLAKIATRPGGRGDFVVTCDGRVLWDKKRNNDNQFPDAMAILNQLA